MTRFQVGDLVYVPHAYDTQFQPYLTKVDEIEYQNGKLLYCCTVKKKNYAAFNQPDDEQYIEFEEYEVFSPTELKKCEKYISDKYYGGLCSGCKYGKISGDIWRCNDCQHKITVSATQSTDWNVYKCGLTGIVVGNQKKHICSEICKYYSPTLPQNIKNYVSWQHYQDILKNCEFNPDCIHHRKSVHHTVSYERYLNETVRIPISFKMGEETVIYVRIYRKDWNDGNFIDGDVITCVGVGFAPLLTEKGKVKKGTYNRGESFDVPKKINMITGEFV